MKRLTLMTAIGVASLGLFNSFAYATEDKSVLQQQKTINVINKPASMKFNNYVYIFLGPGLDPKRHRSVIKTDTFTFTTIGVDMQKKEDVIAVAKQAVANGAQMIELCGGFGAIWIAKVTEAIEGKVPVGGVFYGPEARKPLLDLLTAQKGESY